MPERIVSLLVIVILTFATSGCRETAVSAVRPSSSSPLMMLGPNIGPVISATPISQNSNGTLPSEVWIANVPVPALTELRTHTNPKAIPGTGTMADPYQAQGGNIDPIMKYIDDTYNTQTGIPPLVIHLTPGNFTTKGSGWNGPNYQITWYLLSNHSLVGAGQDITFLDWDYSDFTNSTTDIQWVLIQGLTFNGPQLNQQPPIWAPAQNQVIQNMTIRGNFSKAILGFTHTDGSLTSHTLRLGGVVIFGNNSEIDHVHFTDFGSSDLEAFVADIAGAQHDTVVNGTTFYGGGITDCLYDGAIDPMAQQHQLTVFTVGGSANYGYDSSGNQLSFDTPLRVDLKRKGALLARNRVIIDDRNQATPGGSGNIVQGFQNFNVDDSVISDNQTYNAGAGYYQDWWQQNHVVISNNHFERASIGVALQLDQYAGFKQENYQISNNVMTMIPIYSGGIAAVRLTRYLWGNESFDWFPDVGWFHWFWILYSRWLSGSSWSCSRRCWHRSTLQSCQ